MIVYTVVAIAIVVLSDDLISIFYPATCKSLYFHWEAR